MKDKILTLNDLALFYKNNKTKTFSAKESGKSIVVSTPARFEMATQNTDDGLLHCTLRVCHSGPNLNYSKMSDTALAKACPTLAYKPVLGYIHQLDNGKYDFQDHTMRMEMTEDGFDMIYDEQQIGCFTNDEAYLEYDKETDRHYVIAKAVIPRQYTKAASIIEEKNGTDVSCEIEIFECVYDEKDDYLDIKDFMFTGCTCLGSWSDGTPVMPAMEKACLTIDDFSKENNGINFSKKEMLEMREKIDTILSRFNIDSEGKEDTPMEDNKNIIDEIDAEIETSEQVEEPVVEEVTEAPEETTEEVVTEEAPEEEVVETPEEEAPVEDEAVEEVPEKSEYDLLVEEFEDYKNSHSHSNEEYDALETYKNEAEFAKLHSQREAILNDSRYAVLADVETFKKLVEEMHNYSLDDLEKEAKIIFADYIASVGNYSITEPQTSVKLFSAVARENTESRYGNIFNN